MSSFSSSKLAVIGLGYVGLPLAVEFGKRYSVIGFDVSEARVADLRAGIDHTNEVSAAELKEAPLLTFAFDTNALKDCDVFIVAVPTPVDATKRPDFTPAHHVEADNTREAVWLDVMRAVKARGWLT